MLRRTFRDLTKPRKVDGDLLSKVFPDVIQRLVLVPLAPTGPVVVQDLADVQLRWRGAWTWMLERTLERREVRLLDTKIIKRKHTSP